jgi:hypothetical protein
MEQLAGNWQQCLESSLPDERLVCISRPFEEGHIDLDDHAVPQGAFLYGSPVSSSSK